MAVTLSHLSLSCGPSASSVSQSQRRTVEDQAQHFVSAPVSRSTGDNFKLCVRCADGRRECLSLVWLWTLAISAFFFSKVLGSVLSKAYVPSRATFSQHCSTHSLHSCDLERTIETDIFGFFWLGIRLFHPVVSMYIGEVLLR